mmetsp:Transcript_25203/g.54847  ORF Transcript_25203/g.54847 Transcript_25203/m.54847 type:complete len:170 (-) Transcript_25203:228-737(-)
MHAFCLQLLCDHLVPGAHVLDVGSGSGYLTAVMGHMVGAEGHVVGIDHISQLVEQSKKDMRANAVTASLMDAGAVEVMVGDGREGLPSAAPYDAIHVGAASPEVPEGLVAQLAPGGRMVVPVGEQGQMQCMTVVDKRVDGTIATHKSIAVTYVPLTSRRHQLNTAWWVN